MYKQNMIYMGQYCFSAFTLLVDSWLTGMASLQNNHASDIPKGSPLETFRGTGLTGSIFTRATHSIARYMLRQRGWLGGWLSQPVLCLND